MAKYAEFVVNINNMSNNMSNGQTKSVSIDRFQRKKTNKKINTKNKALNLVNIYGSRTAQVINSKVGQYTGNRVATSNRQEIITLGSLALTAFINPGYAIGASAVHIANNIADFAFRQINSREESNYRSSLLGNMATSNSRWRGNFR